MRNAKRTGRMKKHTGMLMMTAILVCGLTACQGTEEAEDISSETLVTSEQESTNVVDEETSAMKETQDEQEGNEQPGSGQEQQNRYMGEITAIEDNVITVTVMGGGQFRGGMPEGKMPEGEFFEGGMPENIQPAVKPEGAPAEGVEPGEKWEGSEPDEMPEGKTFEGMEQKEKPEGFEPGGMPEGETMVIEVSEDTIITLNEEIGEITDLKVGDFIQFTMDGDLVTEINVGMPQQDDLQKETENAETTE